MADDPQQSEDADEAKRRFREALERKSRMSQARQAHEDGRAKVRGMSGPADRKKVFRRKMG
ncbi:MAG TPA: DUF5302 domain-containing protein [Streptomyces sp.]|nr:DUF5302 domain-containing protein [Streptomyces sp.]